MVWAFRVCGRFFRPGGQVSREVNRGRDANVAPGPAFLLLFVFSSPTWYLPPEKSPRQQCQSGASCRCLVRGGPCSLARKKKWEERKKNGKRKWEELKRGDFSELFRWRRSVLPARWRLPGTTQRRRRRRSAPPNLVADVTLVRPGGRRRRGNNRGESAETATSRSYFAGMENAGGATDAVLPQRHLVGLFRAAKSLSGRPIPPNK